MKHISEYIIESIKHLLNNVKGLVVFDIDDTLLKIDSSILKIYKTLSDGNVITLSTEEYAKDPDSEDLNKKDLFDYKDFYDPEKVYKSIMQGTPLIKNLRIMDSYINAGYDFCFLTARGCEDIVKDALSKFLEVKKPNGELKEIDNIFKKAISHAVNDTSKYYKGTTDADKKANILIELCSKYDKVVFVDDDKKNVQAAKSLNLPNLKIIKAWGE